MNRSDEDLQQNIEKGHVPDDSLDSRIYRSVFKALRSESYRLPDHFADKVISTIGNRKPGLSSDYLWFGLGLLTFVAATVVVVLRTDLEINLRIFNTIPPYSGLIVFALFLVLLIQYVDKRLIWRKDM